MSMQSLGALRVLVTRPLPQQQELVAAIEAASGKVLHLPLLEITPRAIADRPAELIAKVQNLDNYHILIFVSANAVLYGLQWIDHYWPQFPEGVDLVAIGPGTARELSATSGRTVIYSETGSTTEDLLALPLFAQVTDKRVGIVRGQGGRELLAQTLRDRGARVDYLEVYERRSVRYQPREFIAQLKAHAINVLTVTSGESLHHLATLLGDNKAEMTLLPLLVPSPRVAAEASALGFSHVVPTGGADVASVMTALAQLAAAFPA